MNFTNYLKGNRPEKNKFSLDIKDEKIQMSINILKDIKKTTYIIKNYNKLYNKFDLDEYFAYFLQDKNSFITEFKDYIEQSDNKSLSL